MIILFDEELLIGSGEPVIHWDKLVQLRAANMNLSHSCTSGHNSLYKSSMLDLYEHQLKSKILCTYGGYG